MNNSNSSYNPDGTLDSCFKVGTDKEKEEASRLAKKRENEVSKLLVHPIIKEDVKKIKNKA